jgi:hypothetical protein
MPNTLGEHLLGKLAPGITARAAEIEAERQFPLDLAIGRRLEEELLRKWPVYRDQMPPLPK